MLDRRKNALSSSLGHPTLRQTQSWCWVKPLLATPASRARARWATFSLWVREWRIWKLPWSLNQNVLDTPHQFNAFDFWFYKLTYIKLHRTVVIAMCSNYFKVANLKQTVENNENNCSSFFLKVSFWTFLSFSNQPIIIIIVCLFVLQHCMHELEFYRTHTLCALNTVSTDCTVAIL